MNDMDRVVRAGFIAIAIIATSFIIGCCILVIIAYNS